MEWGCGRALDCSYIHFRCTLDLSTVKTEVKGIAKSNVQYVCATSDMYSICGMQCNMCHSVF